MIHVKVHGDQHGPCSIQHVHVFYLPYKLQLSSVIGASDNASVPSFWKLARSFEIFFFRKTAENLISSLLIVF